MAITLDREQRMALRFEMELCANSVDDLTLYIARGDREGAHRIVKRAGEILALLDAIGWSEQADAPNDQSVPITDALASWSRGEAEELAAAFADFVPGDRDLDAHRALALIGGA
jgi:hypothetical protein